MRRAVLLFAAPLRLAHTTGACWAPQAQRCFATAEQVAEQSGDDEPWAKIVPEASICAFMCVVVVQRGFISRIISWLPGYGYLISGYGWPLVVV